jgi:hypothetical protein
MFANRVQSFFETQMPQSTVSIAESETFLPCFGLFAGGMAAQQWTAYQHLCRLAYEKALAETAPPRCPRLLFYWN